LSKSNIQVKLAKQARQPSLTHRREESEQPSGPNKHELEELERQDHLWVLLAATAVAEEPEDPEPQVVGVAALEAAVAAAYAAAAWEVADAAAALIDGAAAVPSPAVEVAVDAVGFVPATAETAGFASAEDAFAAVVVGWAPAGRTDSDCSASSTCVPVAKVYCTAYRDMKGRRKQSGRNTQVCPRRLQPHGRCHESNGGGKAKRIFFALFLHVSGARGLKTKNPKARAF